jgi:hypothetical protein
MSCSDTQTVAYPLWGTRVPRTRKNSLARLSGVPASRRLVSAHRWLGPSLNAQCAIDGYLKPGITIEAGAEAGAGGRHRVVGRRPPTVGSVTDQPARWRRLTPPRCRWRTSFV